MKFIKISLLISVIGILSISSYGQKEPPTDQEQIRELLKTFMECIRTRDTLTMFSLFADAPVTWIGVWKPETQKERLEMDPKAPAYKISDYKTWFGNVIKNGVKQELFSNAVIVQDGSIGSVTFDYSFWNQGKKGNWGKESWGLIKVDGNWKIASVIFSMELERVLKQPAEIHGPPVTINPEIEKYIQSQVNIIDFKGTVLVAKGDSIIHQSAYGMFDVENKIPNELNTQFLIGSLTKSFVGVAVMKLVETGLVDLKAPVLNYIPNLKAELAEDLQVHHLLKQQSGLAPSFDDLTEFEIMDISSSELLDIINTSPRSFQPGEKYQYSNINYSLLAMVIENASGVPYPDYLNEQIFKPLGMTQTGMERLSNIPENRAVGYREIFGKVRRVQNVVSYAMGAGDIYSTSSDLFNWSRALNTDRLLTAESKALLFEAGNEDWGYYGYGFRIQPYLRKETINGPGTLIRHGGTMNGFISNYSYYREDDITIILLSNFRNVPIRRLSFDLKEIVLGTSIQNRKNIHKE
ncbi:serine hydrolase domain-containing protein [Algoriphagus confluentis]|uniref:Beta-lactamase-related domain-containing protein n=1 Tax=Algoriphagus confluentis TaxID=1697556 RepID=A0ABQ6PRZ6_9BACT|nr:hypothetical protein Aconfl_33870 [Algoriphagus confluentis]